MKTTKLIITLTTSLLITNVEAQVDGRALAVGAIVGLATYGVLSSMSNPSVNVCRIRRYPTGDVYDCGMQSPNRMYPVYYQQVPMNQQIIYSVPNTQMVIQR